MALTQADLDRILGTRPTAQGIFNANQPTIKNTPRSTVSGTWADILKPIVSNPVGEFVGAADMQRALDSASYGKPLTTGGSVQTGGFRPEYLAAALGLTPTGKAKKLSSLEQNILDKGGDYALQRFNKAKSLVPDLETQYTPKAIERLFTQRDMYGLTVMKPSEFENFSSPLSSDVESIKKYSKKSLEDNDYVSYPEYIDYLKQVSKDTGFSDVPYFHLNKSEVGLPLNTFISGHEGRHRTRALSELGNNPTLVELKPRGDLYQSLPTNISDYGLPINTQQEFVNALNKEMALNKNVRPQTYLESQPNSLFEKQINREAIPFSGEIFGAGVVPLGLLSVDKEKTKKK